MPIVKSASKLFFQQNLLALLFSPMKRVLSNPDTNKVAAVFKMNMQSTITIFSDEAMQQEALKCEMKDVRHMIWDVKDVEHSGLSIAKIKMNRFKAIARFGKEDFTIKKPDGSEWMTLDTNSTVSKHIMDNLTVFYNPTHQYQIKNPTGEVVAVISAKAGFFHQRYDFEIIGGDEAEGKVALTVFAVITLMLQK
jgi:hypothetical protein